MPAAAEICTSHLARKARGLHLLAVLAPAPPFAPNSELAQDSISHWLPQASQPNSKNLLQLRCAPLLRGPRVLHPTCLPRVPPPTPLKMGQEAPRTYSDPAGNRYPLSPTALSGHLNNPSTLPAPTDTRHRCLIDLLHWRIRMRTPYTPRLIPLPIHNHSQPT